jgi:hypothetical protein
MAKSSDVSGKFTMRLTISILLLPALMLYLVILNLISRWVVSDGAIFHWFPIALSAFAFFIAGCFAGAQDYDSKQWMKTNGKGEYFIFCHPLGHTEAEMDEAVAAQYKKDEYSTSDKTIIVGFLVFDAIILGVSLFFSTYMLNAVVAFPVWIITALLISIPSGASFTSSYLGDDWKEYVCEDCGCINGKYDYTTSNRKESSWVESNTVDVTDKYTNGIDTIWVERTEVVHNIKHNTTFDENYVCRRCKKKTVKKFSYTKNL